MKTSVRFRYLKALSFLLATVGFIVGFSQKVIAQYGAPMVRFLLKGTVYSQKAQQPVPEIFVGRNFYGDSVFSDQAGKYAYRTEVDWGTEKINILAKDADGTKNGAFKPELATAKLSQRPDTVMIDFFLKEEETIQEIIEKNSLPQTYNGKRIQYEHVLYAPEFNYVMFRTPLSAQTAHANVSLNNIMLKDNMAYTEFLNFEITLDQDVNFFLFEINTSDQGSEPQNIVFQNDYDYSKIKLPANTSYYHGIIIVKLQPEKE